MMVFVTMTALSYLGLASLAAYLFIAVKKTRDDGKQRGIAHYLVSCEEKIQKLKKANEDVRNAINIAFEDIDYLERLSSGVSHGYGLTYYINGTTRVRRSQAARKVGEKILRSLEYLSEQEQTLVQTLMRKFEAGEEVQPFCKMLNIDKDGSGEVILVKFDEWKWWRKAAMIRERNENGGDAERDTSRKNHGGIEERTK